MSNNLSRSLLVHFRNSKFDVTIQVDDFVHGSSVIRKSRMDALPNEMLVGILKNLDDSDLEKCMDVCFHWKDLINEAVGVTGFFGIHPTIFFHESRGVFQNINEIGEIGINSCVLGYIGNSECPHFLNDYLVKKVYGPISLINFNKLMSPLVNLTVLMFHLPTLNSLNFAQSNTRLTFPKLKSLLIYGDSNSGHFLFHHPDHDNIFENFLTIFLDTFFPELRTLLMFCVPLISITDESPLMEALAVFLVKHKHTLRVLEMKNMNHLNFYGTLPVIPEIRNLFQLQLDTFGYYSTVRNPEHIEELFNQIITPQTSIRHFLNTIGTFRPNLIRHNSSTLSILELIVCTNADTVIDCEILGQCTAPKFLTIVADIDGDVSRTGTILNTNFLLNSILDSIRLIRFYLSTTDATGLLTKEWKALKFLELQYIGTTGNFGVPFDAICTLLTQKTVRNVHIHRGMNSESFEAAKSGPKESIPVLAGQLLESNATLDGLIVTLCMDSEDNYYTSSATYGRGFIDPDLPRSIYRHSIYILPDRKEIGFFLGFPFHLFRRSA